jgi:hypothetical protein
MPFLRIAEPAKTRRKFCWQKRRPHRLGSTVSGPATDFESGDCEELRGIQQALAADARAGAAMVNFYLSR